MDLSLILKEDGILLDFETHSKMDCLEAMTDVLYEKGIISDKGEFLSAVVAREQLSTTGVGQQIAIPHGKSSVVNTTSCIIAKVKHPVEWESFDGQPVKLVFLLAIEEKDQNDTHLRILSTLAGKLMDEEFVQQLLNSSTEKALYNALIVDDIVEIEEQFI